MFARPTLARYLCIKYPGSSPNFILTSGSPPSRPHWTANLPCKARCISRNLRIQQHTMSLRMSSINNIISTSVGVNTFRTIVLHTLTTNCDGGALVTTQRTKFCLILSLIFRGFSGAPNRRGQNQKWLHHPCLLGGSPMDGDKFRSGCISPAFLGADSFVWGAGGGGTGTVGKWSKNMPGALIIPLIYKPCDDNYWTVFAEVV